jgi:hypothetical protein
VGSFSLYCIRRKFFRGSGFFLPWGPRDPAQKKARFASEFFAHAVFILSPKISIL